MTSINNKTLPESYKKYFWDCNFKELTLEKYPKYIIERILNFGTIDEIKWIKANTEENYFREIATTSRRLDKRTKNFWKTLYSHRNDK